MEELPITELGHHKVRDFISALTLNLMSGIACGITCVAFPSSDCDSGGSEQNKDALVMKTFRGTYQSDSTSAVRHTAQALTST